MGTSSGMGPDRWVEPVEQNVITVSVWQTFQLAGFSFFRINTPFKFGKQTRPLLLRLNPSTNLENLTQGFFFFFFFFAFSNL